MFGDLGLNDLVAELSDRSYGSGLVLSHERLVADHIGRQDGGKATFSLILGHRKMISIWPGPLTPFQAPSIR